LYLYLYEDVEDRIRGVCFHPPDHCISLVPFLLPVSLPSCSLSHPVIDVSCGRIVSMSVGSYNRLIGSSRQSAAGWESTADGRSSDGTSTDPIPAGRPAARPAGRRRNRREADATRVQLFELEHLYRFLSEANPLKPAILRFACLSRWQAYA